MLNVVLGRRSPGEPEDSTICRIEGWMLGRRPDSDDDVNTHEEVDAVNFSPSGKHSPAAEYDPLANLYDREYVHDYDVPFWLSVARREGGPVVEWGTGTGRIAVPLSKEGFDVTAVELSGKMAERGRSKSETVEWVHGDMRSAKLSRRFRLAICAFNSFLCLTSLDEAMAFLGNAREHLEPGGLLGIEVSAFSPQELAEDADGPERQHDFTRKLQEGKLERFSLTRYDDASQIMEMRLFYEMYDGDGALQSSREHDLKIRVTNRDELILMLRLTGFELEAVYGGFEGEPFSAESDHLVVLARKT